MNHPRIQDALVIAVFLLIIFGQSLFHDDEPEVIKVIEQSKQLSLSDAPKNELALYRQEKYLTTFGDNR